MAHSPPEVQVYGADWCEDTHATRNHLNNFGVQYQYVNIDKDPSAQEWVKQQNGGKQRTPTVNIGGDILVEPSEGELALLLRSKGLMA